MLSRRVVLITILLSALPAAAADKVCTLPDDAGKYVLSLPKDYDPKKEYELIVALHGSGDPPEHFVKALRALMPTRDYILAAPYSKDVMEWRSTEIPAVEATVTDVQKNCRIQKDRVLLLGYSAGGGIGFFFIAQRPKLFAGFAGFAQAVNTEELPDEEFAAAKDVLVYYSVGSDDKYAAASVETDKTLKRLGFTYAYDAPHGVGHIITREQLKRCFDWFDAAFKKKDAAESTNATAAAQESDDMTIRERRDDEEEKPRMRPVK